MLTLSTCSCSRFSLSVTYAFIRLVLTPFFLMFTVALGHGFAFFKLLRVLSLYMLLLFCRILNTTLLKRASPKDHQITFDKLSIQP